MDGWVKAPLSFGRGPNAVDVPSAEARRGRDPGFVTTIMIVV